MNTIALQSHRRADVYTLDVDAGLDSLAHKRRAACPAVRLEHDSYRIGGRRTILDLVIDPGTATADDRGVIFSVDPATGQRTVVSDFGDANQGTLGFSPLGVAIGNSGSILVVDPDVGTGESGALFGVDATTGQRTW